MGRISQTRHAAATKHMGRIGADGKRGRFDNPPGRASGSLAFRLVSDFGRRLFRRFFGRHNQFAHLDDRLPGHLDGEDHGFRLRLFALGRKLGAGLVLQRILVRGADGTA